MQEASRQASGQHEDRAHFVGQIPRGDQLANPFGMNLIAVKDRKVGTARDGDDAGGVDAMTLGDHLRDELRDRNHWLSARHDAVIAPFCPRAFVIGAVIGGHERCRTAAPRRPIAAPGRAATARMDQIDIFLSDQLSQAPRIAPQGERSLCVEGQFYKLAAHRPQFRLQPSAAGGHQRAASGGPDRLGHFDCPALDTALIERWDELQDCRPPLAAAGRTR